MNLSGIFKLNGRDLLNGLFMALVSSVFTYVSQASQLTDLSFEQCISVVVITTLTYLSKNLSTAENGKLGGVL